MKNWIFGTAITFGILAVMNQAFAQEIVAKRPDGLKAQVTVMKQEVPQRFECMVAEIKEAHGNDKSTFLYVLKKNVTAYWDVREGDFPTKIIAVALNNHPCDFSTALYVIKKDTKASSELSSLLD